MNTLILDTSHSLLVVGLADDNNLIDYKQEIISKKHSELLLVTIDKILKKNSLSPLDIHKIVVTDGPGSYTGMRIGIAFAKTYALANPNVEIYVIDTLISIAGKNSGFSLIDARSNRFFGGFVIEGNVQEQRIYTKEEVLNISSKLYGDTHIMDGSEPNYLNIAQNILDVHNQWKRVDNVDTLVPRYLK